MITESYSASCYIENKDGQYHMECDLQTDDYTAYSEYDGNSFVTGLNALMNDIQTQALKKPEPKSEEEVLKEKILYLESLVNDLRNEKIDLINKIDKLESKNNFTKKTEPESKNKNIGTLEEYLEDILGMF